MREQSLLSQLLREMETLSPRKERVDFLEEKARRAFEVASRFVEYIEENYNGEEAEELKKRFLSSVKRKNFRKFEIALGAMRGESPDDSEES